MAAAGPDGPFSFGATALAAPVVDRPALDRPVFGQPAPDRRTRERPAPGRPAPGRPVLGSPALQRPASRPRREPLLRVAPPVPVSTPRAPFVALVLGVVVVGVLGVLVLNTKINENAFRLSDLQARQTTLDQQEQQLRAQLAVDQSPNNLAAAARRMGLVPATTPAYLTLPDGTVVGVPQPASAGSAGR